MLSPLLSLATFFAFAIVVGLSGSAGCRPAECNVRIYSKLHLYKNNQGIERDLRLRGGAEPDRLAAVKLSIGELQEFDKPGRTG
jgi:hypothetical protein